MKKYLQVLKMSWQNTLAYRSSFVMWRLRRMLALLATYFFWLAVYQGRTQVGSYDESRMLTYVIMMSVLSVFIFASRSVQVSGDIGTGSLSNYLLKPIKYFGWMFFLDLGDKISNLFFLVFELLIFFALFRPSFVWPQNPFIFLAFLVAVGIGIVVYFFLSLLVSLLTFWYPEHNGWPIRFLFDMTLVFLSGGWFPLDILPSSVYKILLLLPTSYLRFIPMKIYLSQGDWREIGLGLLGMVFWMFALMFVGRKAWRWGLKHYQAEGI